MGLMLLKSIRSGLWLNIEPTQPCQNIIQLHFLLYNC